MFELDPKKSLEVSIACHSRDWSKHYRDAWIYGIVCGWGDAWDDIARPHNWKGEAIERLKLLHEKFKGIDKERRTSLGDLIEKIKNDSFEELRKEAKDLGLKYLKIIDEEDNVIEIKTVGSGVMFLRDNWEVFLKPKK